MIELRKYIGRSFTLYYYRKDDKTLSHREDGPALEYYDGYKYWYFHGEPLHCSSQEEFEKLIKLKAFW